MNQDRTSLIPSVPVCKMGMRSRAMSRELNGVPCLSLTLQLTHRRLGNAVNVIILKVQQSRGLRIWIQGWSKLTGGSFPSNTDPTVD